MKLPVFGPKHALCDNCELAPQCDKGLWCGAYAPPDNFNGIMFIGEGPGQQEIVEGRPFIGVSGRLLRSILDTTSINFDESYVTNATLCKPPPSKSKALQQEYPNAIPSCLPRLEAEIAAVRPKVIITLGAAALIAVTGYDVQRTKLVKFDCENCDANRRVGPVLQCSNKLRQDDGTTVPCGHIHYLESTEPDYVAEVKGKGCESCGDPLKRVRPKMVKCPKCGGRKSRPEQFEEFKWDFNITDVAGAIFEPVKEGVPTQAHELDSWLHEQGVQYVIPTYHPAYILRDKQFIAKPVQKHFRKALRLVKALEPQPWNVDYEVTKEPAVVRAFFAKHKGANFGSDVETVAEGVNEDGSQRDARIVNEATEITCIGFATTDKALVVDTRGASDELLDTIYDEITDPSKKLTWHNGGGYDIPVMDLLWGMPWEETIRSYRDDTLNAHHVLYPDEPHKLGHVACSMTETRAWKPPRRSHGNEVHESFESLALYNARDVVNTSQSRNAMGVDGGFAKQGGRVWRAKLQGVYPMDMELQRIAVGMTMRGMPIRLEAMAEARKRVHADVEDARNRMRENLAANTGFKEPETFNPNSPQQVSRALYTMAEGYALMPTTKTKTGAPSAEGKVLRQMLLDLTPMCAEFVQALLDYKEHEKIRSTYIDSRQMKPWADGRIHTTWKPFGTRTGRFSSSPNFQNWPKWLRSFVVAPEGRIFVGADYSQLELRGVAAISGDATLIEKCMTADESRKLEPEHDPHSFVAALAFGKAFTKLDLKDPDHDKTNERCRCDTCTRKALRDLTKRVIYGLNYGSGAQTVLDAIYATGDYSGPPISLAMVQNVSRMVFEAFPGVKRWRDEQVAAANDTGEIRSPIYGRRRIFPLDEVPITEVYNFPIQSMAADIMNRAMIDLDGRLASADPNAFIIAQVHDALYIECDEDKAEAVAALLEECMSCEHVLVEGAPAMAFPAAAAISKNWKEAG